MINARRFDKTDKYFEQFGIDLLIYANKMEAYT